MIETVATTHHRHKPVLDEPRPGRAGERATRPEGTRRLAQNTRLTAVTTLPVRNNAALADAAPVASSPVIVPAPVAVSSMALDPRRMPLVSEAEFEEKRSSGDLANGLPVSRGGRMPILDDQGAEMLLAAGFTGVLASWSMRGSLTGRAGPDARTTTDAGAPMCG